MEELVIRVSNAIVSIGVFVLIIISYTAIVYIIATLSCIKKISEQNNKLLQLLLKKCVSEEEIKKAQD